MENTGNSYKVAVQGVLHATYTALLLTFTTYVY